MDDLLSSEVIVGNRAFRVQKLPAMKGSLLFNRVMRIFVPSAADALSGTKGITGIKGLLNADTSRLGPALSSFFEKMTEAEQERLLRDLFEPVRMRTDKGEWVPLIPVLDAAFQGKIKEMFVLAWKCLDFQFGDFFGSLKSAVSDAMEKAEVSTPTG